MPGALTAKPERLKPDPEVERASYSHGNGRGVEGKKGRKELRAETAGGGGHGHKARRENRSNKFTLD